MAQKKELACQKGARIQRHKHIAQVTIVIRMNAA